MKENELVFVAFEISALEVLVSLRDQCDDGRSPTDPWIASAPGES